MKKVLSLLLVLVLALAVFVACRKDGETSVAITQEIIDGAADMLYEFNKPGANNIKAANFTLPTATEYEGVAVTITWSVEGGNGLVTVENGETTATIKLNKYATEDTAFTLKGLVKAGDFQKEISFSYLIKEYVISDWAYWNENTKGATMNIKGVIVDKYIYEEANTRTTLFLEDLDGQHGYMAYRVACASKEAYDTDLAIGNVVVINGTTSIYNGLREMGAGCTYEVMKNDDGATVTAEVKKVALDDQFTEGNTGLAAYLDPLQCVIGTVTGAKIKSIEWNSNNASNYEEKGAGSIYVTVVKNGVELKLYVSTSCQYTLADLKAVVDSIAVGYTVNVEGPIAWYNAPQLYPVVGGITVTSTEVSAEDKIVNEAAKISFPMTAETATELTLAAAGTTYTDVAFAWALNEGAQAAKIENGKLILTPAEGKVETVTLTLTLTCGDATATRTYQIIVGEMTPENIVNTAYGLTGKATLPDMTLTGVIVKVDTAYSDQYKNITVTIVIGDLWDKPIQCFRAVAADDKVDISGLAVGNTITTKGTLKNYNGTIEFDTGNKISAVEATEASAALKLHVAVSAITVAEAFEKDAEVTLAAADATYTDVTFAWALNESAAMAKIENGKLIVTPVEGEPETVTLTLTATLGNDTLTKAFTFTVSKANLTPEQIVEKAFALTTDDKPMEDVTLSGTALIDGTKIYIVVSGMVDKKIQCYKLAGAEGIDITGLATGDNITVNGKIKNFRGTIEFDQGCKVTELYKVADILTDAFALDQSAALEKTVTLTGEVKRLDKNKNPYIFVDGMEEGKEIECYKLKGAEGVDISTLAVGDTITINGTIKNFRGTIEFDQGCIAYSLVKPAADETAE